MLFRSHQSENVILWQEAVKVLENISRIGICTPIVSKIDIKEALQRGSVTAAMNTSDNEHAYFRERPNLVNEFSPPRTEMEEVLQSLFQEFFGIEMVGIEDNFFELGGDSLKCLMMIRKIKNAFQVELSIRDFFENPSIRLIAVELNSRKSESSGVAKSNGKVVIL